jgi:hypothetical protein
VGRREVLTSEGLLLLAADEQIGAQEDDIDHCEEQAGEPLLLLVFGQCDQQLGTATHDHLVVCGLDHRKADGALEGGGLEGEDLLVTVAKSLGGQTG